MRASIRLAIGLIVLGACAREPARPVVRPGLDVLLADSVHLVSGRRVGIVTNQTGVDRAGVDAVTRLLDAGIRLTAIFSPEHGYRGVLDVENIEHGVDSATGLPVFSLYGATREPTPEMLARVDAILIDLQDIGARPYTYVSTALGVLRAASAAGVEVIVLDRPNPIGGLLTQGPVLDTAFASWVGMLPVPLRHGLTMGELVRFGDAVLDIEGPLHVVPVDGWDPGMWFDETGLPWIRPSPNMPSLESATHYPGLVLFERTNLSVGRGTPIAFQVVGAPWMDAGAVVRAVGEHAGVSLGDTTVTPVSPSDGKYDGHTIPVVRLAVTDRETYDPVALTVRLLAAIRAVHRDSLTILARGFDERAGTDALRRALDEGVDPTEIATGWVHDLEAFRRRVGPLLIYPRGGVWP